LFHKITIKVIIIDNYRPIYKKVVIINSALSILVTINGFVFSILYFISPRDSHPYCFYHSVQIEVYCYSCFDWLSLFFISKKKHWKYFIF